MSISRLSTKVILGGLLAANIVSTLAIKPLPNPICRNATSQAIIPCPNDDMGVGGWIGLGALITILALGIYVAKKYINRPTPALAFAPASPAIAAPLLGVHVEPHEPRSPGRFFAG